jgi:hypothetical protein
LFLSLLCQMSDSDAESSATVGENTARRFVRQQFSSPLTAADP